MSPSLARKRALLGCGLSIALALGGGFLLLGLPGAFALEIADLLLPHAGATSRLQGLRESAWPLAIIVTLLTPMPIVPVQWRLARREPAPGRSTVVLAAAAALAVWSLVLALLALLLFA